MKNDIQEMSYRMQFEITEKLSDAARRAVQRFYGRDYNIELLSRRVFYSREGGDAVLSDRKTGQTIIMIKPNTTIAHDYSVTLQANYLTFDGKK